MEAMQEVMETRAVDLGALLDAGDGAVVTLVAGDTRLAAHRAVLSARSPVFAAMFRHDSLEASSGQVEIPDVEGPVLRQLLAYLYTLQVPQLPSKAPELLAAADKYGISVLKEHCEQHIARELSVETAAAAAVLAVRHSCSSLRLAAVNFMKANFAQVMATQGWADAVYTQPQDVVEVSRLLADPPVEASTPAAGDAGPAPTSRPHSDGGRQTPAPAVASAAARPTTLPEDAAVSRLRSLSAEEKGRRLREAAKEGAVGELRALLAAGADVGAVDGDRRTALHWAAREGHAEAASCLLGSGAEVDARTSWQGTPLHAAAYRGRTAVVRLLLASSASHSARREGGWTPLHFAAAYGHAETAAALLEAGASRAARNDEGETPLDLARQYNNQQLVELLSSN